MHSFKSERKTQDMKRVQKIKGKSKRGNSLMCTNLWSGKFLSSKNMQVAWQSLFNKNRVKDHTFMTQIKYTKKKY